MGINGSELVNFSFRRKNTFKLVVGNKSCSLVVDNKGRN